MSYFDSCGFKLIRINNKIMRIFYTTLLSFFLILGYGQDAYHTDLIQYLQENFNIENPEFILNNTEAGNINALSLYGNSSSTTSDIPDFNFTKVENINVNGPGANQWDSGYTSGSKNAIAEDDNVLITFWAKQNSTSSNIFLFAENAQTYEKEAYLEFGLTPDWTQYFLPISAARDYPTGNMTVGFHLATQAQNIDIAGFTVLNYGSAYDLDELPSSFGSGYQGSEPDAPWRALAASRIEQIRKADLNVTVVNENGQLIEDAEVKIEMVEHDFGFGSAFVTCRFPGNNCYNSTYVDKVLDLDGQGHGFNVGVTENAVKWDAWEENWLGTPTQTADAIEWLHDNGVTMRGHTLIWPGFQYLPDDIGQNQNDLDYLRQRIDERIETMINHPRLKNIIREWDVFNEITQNRDFENAFKNDPNFTTGREIYTEIFEKIRALDPDLKLYMNDYVVLSGGGSSQTVINRYKSFLNEIDESTQPFDGIGFQCHIGSTPTSITKLENVLNEFYQRYEKPIKITEYDINDLVDEDVAANYMSDFLTMIYSHPAVEAYIMWGFWDGNHWKDNAPMFDLDWNLKPSGQAFIDKVFNEWWTNETLTTEATGKANTRVFKGTHKVTVMKDGNIKTSFTTVTEDSNIQIILAGATDTEDIIEYDFTISPNPSSDGYIFVSFPEAIGNIDMHFLSMDGRLLNSQIDVRANSKVEIDLPTGMYLVKVKGKNGSFLKKVVVR